jgi:glycogen debranching enzyme
VSSGPLHEVTCVAGESFVVSDGSGDVRAGTDQGYFLRDTRFLCRFELTVDGSAPAPLNAGVTAPGRASFHAFVPRARSRAIDPTLALLRERTVDGGVREVLRFENRAAEDVRVEVEVTVSSDLATVFDVKHGVSRAPVEPTTLEGGLRFAVGVDRVDVEADPPPELDGGTLRWQLPIPGRGRCELTLRVSATDRYGTVEAPPAGGSDPAAVVARHRLAAGVRFRCSETRFTRLLRRSLDDLASLTVEDPHDPRDRFCAAGSPWFLTLFGRDSIWAAYAAAPVDLQLAAGTLRALARRQGRRRDLDTEEEPGKILHEVRRGALTHEGAFPPNYYGSVDATPLFVLLLNETWRWGLPEDEVEALAPNLEAALGWMADQVAGDADGLLRYLRPGQRGLVNQGWKDSGDGIQHRDGRLAVPPIALVEVQAYAYEAAVRGAELLEHLGRDGAATWRSWAADLRQRVRDRFWVEDERGRFLAVATEADGTPVDAVTSNPGHVLLTDLLDPAERDLVAGRLADPTMDSGWGLRTMSTDAAGYNPLGYHTGSVWPHDTAIAVWGLARGGHVEAATSLLRGLVRAAPHLRFRLPELYGGVPWTQGGYPVPYPVACRPQAWSAAAALLLLRACVGADAHVPEGRVELRPLWPPPFERLEVRSFPLAGGAVDVVVDAGRGVSVDRRDSDLAVTIRGGG